MPKKGINLRCKKCGRFGMEMSARVSNDKYKQEILMLTCQCGHSTRSKAKRAASKARELLAVNNRYIPTPEETERMSQ